ncbi:MAG: hypothetical protein NWE83_07425 [Candidatus Bathyarchaeota archaeon]|nr:hypothetical protein [Candidatus Bathyarchaeota archaeon]
MTRKIGWEKYILEEFDQDSIIGPDVLEGHEQEDQDILRSQIDQIIPIQLFNNKVNTPFGIIDPDNQFSAARMFDCWIGHANFPITDLEFNILDNEIDGLGCVKILSKYRFAIGIEKMFCFSAVRWQIQKELCLNLESAEFVEDDSVELHFTNILEKINNIHMTIDNSEKWAIFIGSDGSVTSISDNQFGSDDEYQVRLKKLKKLKNGNIITCDHV